MAPFEPLGDPAWQRLTWTLLHFLWQGLLVALAAAACLGLFRVRRAQARYALCLLALLAMVTCPIATFVVLDTPSLPAASPGVKSKGGQATLRAGHGRSKQSSLSPFNSRMAGVSIRRTRQKQFVVTAFMRSFAGFRRMAPMNRGTTNALDECLLTSAMPTLVADVHAEIRTHAHGKRSSLPT